MVRIQLSGDRCVRMKAGNVQKLLLALLAAAELKEALPSVLSASRGASACAKHLGRRQHLSTC